MTPFVMLEFLLLVFAMVLFLVAAFVTPLPDRPWHNKLALIGLACWVAAEILSRAAH